MSNLPHPTTSGSLTLAFERAVSFGRFLIPCSSPAEAIRIRQGIYAWRRKHRNSLPATHLALKITVRDRTITIIDPLHRHTIPIVDKALLE